MTQLQMMINILWQSDMRVRIHTLSLNGGSYSHNEKKCSMCQCIMILEGRLDVPEIIIN
jgi:hypothetical protein